MAVKGHAGSISIDSGVVGNAKAWSLDISQDTVDTTTFASNGWKESEATLSSWSGSATVVFDVSGTAEAAVLSAVSSQATISVELQAGTATATASDTYAGTANVTSFSITNDVNGIVEASISFEGTGALTIS